MPSRDTHKILVKWDCELKFHNGILKSKDSVSLFYDLLQFSCWLVLVMWMLMAVFSPLWWTKKNSSPLSANKIFLLCDDTVVCSAPPPPRIVQLINIITFSENQLWFTCIRFLLCYFIIRSQSLSFTPSVILFTSPLFLNPGDDTC